MTEPFDYDGLTAHIRAIRTHDDAHNALRERIEAAFVPVETVATVDAALARATARAEAAEARVKVLEEALQHISRRKWNTMTQGCNAACEAASIARAALGGEHD